MLGIGEVQHQGEAPFLVQLSIQVALHVVDFGLHRSIRLHKQVGMPLDQVPDVALSPVRRILQNQVDLLGQQVSSVL